MWSNISNDVAGSTEVVNDAKHDIWRNSILRYAGYANEAGEAFAPIFPKFLKPSYGISLLYVLGTYIVELILYIIFLGASYP